MNRDTISPLTRRSLIFVVLSLANIAAVLAVDGRTWLTVNVAIAILLVALAVYWYLLPPGMVDR